MNKLLLFLVFVLPVSAMADLVIESANISGENLIASISYTGCSNTEFELIVEGVLYSDPGQYNLSIKQKNETKCYSELTSITKEVKFTLKKFIKDDPGGLLMLNNWQFELTIPDSDVDSLF